MLVIDDGARRVNSWRAVPISFLTVLFRALPRLLYQMFLEGLCCANEMQKALHSMMLFSWVVKLNLHTLRSSCLEL